MFFNIKINNKFNDLFLKIITKINLTTYFNRKDKLIINLTTYFNRKKRKLIIYLF